MSIKMGESHCLGLGVGCAYSWLQRDKEAGRSQRMFYDLTKSPDQENPTYVSYEKAFEQLDSYKKRGFVCVPMCDNTDEKGRCLGHKD